MLGSPNVMSDTPPILCSNSDVDHASVAHSAGLELKKITLDAMISVDRLS